MPMTREGGEERLSLLGDLALNHAISVMRPGQATWQNLRGSQSRIDYLLYRAPQAEVVKDELQACGGAVLGILPNLGRKTDVANGSWTRAGPCMHAIRWRLIWD